MIKSMPHNKKGLALIRQPAEKGFTLIELLVASALFIIISMSVVSIFLVAIRNQRRAFQVQNLQDNARFMIESFSKETRMLTAIQSWSGTQLQILNQNNEVVIYRFNINSNNLQRSVSGGSFQSINSNDVNVVGAFSVIVTGQPMVTITMTFSPKVSPTGTKPGNITVQNTIAVRIY